MCVWMCVRMGVLLIDLYVANGHSDEGEFRGGCVRVAAIALFAWRWWTLLVAL